MKKIVEICGQSYEIDYPTVGKFIDIKVRETQLSKGLATDMVFGTSDQQLAFLYITVQAHFEVLCPQLIKELKVDRLADLSIKDFEMLLKVFVEEIQPWISGVKKEIKERIDDGKGDQK